MPGRKQAINFSSSPEALTPKILELEKKILNLETTVGFLRSRLPLSTVLMPELSAEYSWVRCDKCSCLSGPHNVVHKKALIPDEEKLLLSCTACGAMFGLAVGR
jgi:hypothetical protein